MIFNVNLIKCHFLFFTFTSLCSFSENLLLHVNGFLKMVFGLIELRRFVFPDISYYCCQSKSGLNKINRLNKKTKQKNRQKACPTFYIVRHSLFTICLILLFNKINQAKEVGISYNNV